MDENIKKAMDKLGYQALMSVSYDNKRDYILPFLFLYGICKNYEIDALNFLDYEYTSLSEFYSNESESDIKLFESEMIKSRGYYIKPVYLWSNLLTYTQNKADDFIEKLHDTINYLNTFDTFRDIFTVLNLDHQELGSTRKERNVVIKDLFVKMNEFMKSIVDKIVLGNLVQDLKENQKQTFDSVIADMFNPIHLLTNFDINTHKYKKELLIARDENTAVETLTSLSKHNDYRVKYFVAYNKATPIIVLKEMMVASFDKGKNETSHEANWLVAKLILKNPSCTDEIRKMERDNYLALREKVRAIFGRHNERMKARDEKNKTTK